jgi:xylulokinase
MDYESLIALASRSRPGAGGVIFLPYLSGELQPINDGFARGLLFGLSLSTERADVVRAVLEGTAFAIAHNLVTIESTGIPVTEFRAVGGPTRSALWCQIIADVTGRPLRVMTDSGGAPLGNALLAAKGVGLVDDIAAAALSAAQIERTYEPDKRLYSRYQDQLAIYRALYPQVKEQCALLTNLQ